MRIISGTHKGWIINPPRNLRARPTTDFAKENLFNVLTGWEFDYSECDVLDLFAGTGSVSYEFASRGARSVTAVEINAVHHAFIRRTAAEMGFSPGGKGVGSDGSVGRDGRSILIAVKANVFNYLRACTRQFDIIFSDAPYDLRGADEVITLEFERGLLRQKGSVRDDGSVAEQGGLLIFEHSRGSDFSTRPGFIRTRGYGSVQFSLFSAPELVADLVGDPVVGSAPGSEPSPAPPSGSAPASSPESAPDSTEAFCTSGARHQSTPE